MLAAINVLRGERGHAPATLEQLRPHVSKGARAMILSAFPQLGEAAREALVQPFLDAYEREIGLHGRPFDGVEDMLAPIEADGARLGIVPTTSEYLARQCLPAFGRDARLAIHAGRTTLATHNPTPPPPQTPPQPYNH